MMLPKITGIMACDKHFVISNKGTLPWDCPEDIVFYRKMIKNQVVIMGYNTYQQMPKHFFDDHTCIIFSKKMIQTMNSRVTVVSSLDDFFALNSMSNAKRCYMIGGAEIATLFLKNGLIEDFYLTEIDGYYPGDVFFPMDLMQPYIKQVHLQGPGFTIGYWMQRKEVGQ